MFERTVLFATDFSGDVGEGLSLATRFAREHAATLVVMHVVPMDVNEGAGLYHRAFDLASGHSERKLASLVPTDPGVPFRHVLEVGSPEEKIAAFIEREKVALLVMEARRRSPVSRVFSRTLVERLADRIRCPVVTYRGGNGSEKDGTGVVSLPRRSLSTAALSTILNARVDALLTWLHLQREAVGSIASIPSVRDAVASVYRTERYGLGKVFVPELRNLLELELGEHQRALGALGFDVIVEGQSLLRSGLGARRDAAYAQFLDRVRLQGTAVSVPLHAASERSDATCVLLVGAQIVLSDCESAQLLFTLDARRDFLRILAQPGGDPTAETYAFDHDGVMLSNSRFPDQLRRIGLLPADPGVQAPRLVRVCDPGGNLLTGEVSLSPARPLTRMAAAATGGADGHDWTGYRDYRGVEVVGTWRWLAEYEFGVAAEMDRH